MMLQDTPKQFPTVKEMTAWVYAGIKDRERGDVLSYADLSAMLTLDAQTERGRRAVLNAGRLMLQEHDKHLINVKNVGYQIAQPNEHAGQSQRYRRLGMRRVARALLVSVHVALKELTDAEREKLINEQKRNGLIVAFARKVVRAKKLPAKEMLALPSGAHLVRLITKKTLGVG